MRQALAQVDVHLLFSTKDRRPFVQNADLLNETQHYLGGICNGLDCPILRGGGVADHVVMCGTDAPPIGVGTTRRSVPRVRCATLGCERERLWRNRVMNPSRVVGRN